MGMEISDLWRAAAHIKSDAVTPTYGYLLTGKPVSGFKTSVPIVRNGPGDYTLTLDEANDPSQMAVFIQPSGAAVGSANKSAGWTMPTATTIRVTTLQEQAAGAASILADLDYDIAIMKYPQT